MRLVLAAVLMSLAGAAPAQQDKPAPPPEDMPTVNTEIPAQAPAKRPSGPAAQAPGMTVIGEQESPLGLYIMPWRNSSASGGLDRPARLLEEALLPIDPKVFNRKVIYHKALSEKLEQTGRITP
jgi:hypothetical protein